MVRHVLISFANITMFKFLASILSKDVCIVKEKIISLTLMNREFLGPS